jgi:long-chain acyl-CoA synthetase
MLYRGVTISFNEGLKHIAKNLQEIKPTVLISVPLILENMHKKIWATASKKSSQLFKLRSALKISDFLFNKLNIDFRKKIFKQIHNNIGGHLRIIISGAAAIDPIVMKGFKSFGFNVLQGYGLTECSPIVTVNRLGSSIGSSIGVSLPKVEIKLYNVDSDGIGEIIVKGPNVMLGYFENELATKRVLKNKWLYTGDLAKKDNENFYYITGRKKNVIVTKNGKNIFPEEIESYLNRNKYILESIVKGINNNSGETIVEAIVYPDIEMIKEKMKTSNISNEIIEDIINKEIKSINNKLPIYKKIRKFKIRETEFEKTTTKKIKRYVT